MLVTANAVFAQAAPSGSAVALNAGGFPERRLDVNATGRLTYDSNVLRGFTRPGVDSKNDIIASPGISLDIVQPISRQDLFLNGNLSYNFYKNNSRLNREQIDVIGGADLRAGQRCSARPSIGYSRGLSDLGDLVTAVPATNTQETVDYGVDLRCGGAFGLTGGASYHRAETTNSDSRRRLLNVSSDTYSGDIGLTSRSIGTFSVYGTYRTGRYPFREILVGGRFVDDGIRSYSGGVRYQRQVATYFTGTVSVGMTKVNAKAPGVPNFSGLSYSAQVDYSKDPLTISFLASRDAEQSNLIASTYSIRTLFSLSGSYALTDRLGVYGGATYQKRTFAPPAAGVIPGPIALLRTKDQTYGGTVGANYRLNRRISGFAEVTQEVRRTDPALFNYNSTQFTVGARVSIF